MSSSMGAPKYCMKGMDVVLHCDNVAFAYEDSIDESLTPGDESIGFDK